ncbi:MAG: hypothetical protein FWC73_00155 [Defluviitaleaceae bacterium]|nr:hypothetical protein [Defluviitaleaceae bacterium]
MNPESKTEFAKEQYVINFHSFDENEITEKTNALIWHCITDAAKIAKDLVSASPDKDTRDKDGQNHPLEHNSLIVFTGDRGSGKSTVMRKFTENIVAHIEALPEVKEKVKQKLFVLPVIDPTEFAQDERLVGAIVSRIYQVVHKTINESPGGEINRNTTREVFEHCEKVHDALKTIYTGVKEAVKNNNDGMESLEKLTASTLLKDRLWNLFERFMIWGKYDTLVIPIDDLDMKVTGSYDLLEEIKNCLQIPGVIVTMAVKIEQVTDSLEQYFKDQLKGLPAIKVALDAQPAEMASKYLQKLMPNPRRIALPVLRPDKMSLYEFKYSGLDDGGNGKRKIMTWPLVDKFMELVWRKTGICLVKNQDGSHGLIPHNLRALRHMFAILSGLEDVFGLCKNIVSEKNLSHNLNILESWVLDSASSNAVPRGLARIAREFASRPSENIHAFLIKELEDYSAKSNIERCDGDFTFTKGLFGKDTTIMHMLNPIELFDRGALPENISIGDALYALNSIKNQNPSEGFCHFVATMKMLYSIRMTRALYLSGHALGIDKDDKDKYKELRNVLNGMVYNPRLRLTYEQLEWRWRAPTEISSRGMANAVSQKTDDRISFDELAAMTPDAQEFEITRKFSDTRGGKLITELRKYEDINEQRAAFNNFVKITPNMQRRRKNAVAWQLLFFVGEGRIHDGDLHTFHRTHPTERQVAQYTKTRLRDSAKQHNSVWFNYMAMIFNLLYPVSGFAKRVASVFPGNNNEEKEAFAEELLSKYFDDGEDKWSTEAMIELFSLNCIDVLDELILLMAREADNREDLEEETIYHMGARYFGAVLCDALEEIYKRTTDKSISGERIKEITECAHFPFSAKILVDDHARNMHVQAFTTNDLSTMWKHS